MKTLLEVRDLTKTFPSGKGKIKALDGVSFSVSEGETLGVVGESGCGKTMSAMSILNLIPKTARITSGEIIYNGENLLDKTQEQMREIRGSKISLIPVSNIFILFIIIFNVK